MFAPAIEDVGGLRTSFRRWRDWTPSAPPSARELARQARELREQHTADVLACVNPYCSDIEEDISTCCARGMCACAEENVPSCAHRPPPIIIEELTAPLGIALASAADASVPVSGASLDEALRSVLETLAAPA